MDDEGNVDRVLDIDEDGWPNPALHILSNEHHTPFVMGDIIFAPSQVLTEEGITNVVAILMPITKPAAAVPFVMENQQVTYYTSIGFDRDSFLEFRNAVCRLAERYEAGEI